ncbi:MAG: hypothetical protein V4674_00910 [Patescibacteria group bacterium]
MTKRYILGGLIVLVVAALLLGRSYKQGAGTLGDYKNTEYVLEGEKVLLQNGLSETPSVAGSASNVVTRFFGNELSIDLNDDGREDKVFLLTQERGGSGVFFYAVAALNTEQGYVGSDGYLLGDRIAPQSTEMSKNPQHKNVIVVNYAERMAGEPMTAEPSVGKSAYLKLDPASMKWGVVEADFEGEAR